MCLIYVNYVSLIGVIFLAKPELVSISIKDPHTVIFSVAGVNLPSAEGRFTPATENITVCGSLIDIDTNSGLAKNITPIKET